MASAKSRKLPKWRLKANCLLRELARIWYGKASPYPLFEGQNLVKVFIKIMVQHFMDCHDTEEDFCYARQCICEIYGVQDIEHLLSIKSYPPILYTTQAFEAWDVIIRSLRFLHIKPFLYGKTINDLLWLARTIENRLKSGRKPPYKRLKRVRDLSWYENLPCLPID